MKLINRFILSLVLAYFFAPMQAQIDIDDVSLSYYLEDQEFDPKVPSPSEFLGYEVGTWQVSHDRLVAYMEKLAETSDRVEITEYARSYENRPLVYLTIASPENLSNIDNIKANHKELCDPTVSTAYDPDDLPLILYQGYSIHGDESSGGNAALIIAYYLAAGESKKVTQILDNMVVLLDPCYNPDGFQRYASWINSHRNATINPDPFEREHNEPWPTGRTNHYWFDLNRDWLLLTHPESRGRIKVFQEWNPHVLTDHHEMGTNSTFFFQPGVPSRTNPLTPQINQDLTEGISEYHKQFLDSIGSEYFTKERFDDFYYGKGSTYPDGQGCIGILFEQATSEGFLQESDNGLLSFPFCVRNQVVTSLSTHEGCLQLKEEIVNYQTTFFKERYEEALEDVVKGYVIHIPDPWKRDRFADMLGQHNINVYQSNKNMDEEEFPYLKSLIVPLDQKQTTLVKSIFETQTVFRDSIFYDVSTWTFPFAFNSNYRALAELSGELVKYETEEIVADLLEVNQIVVPWSNYMAPRALYQLISNGFDVRRTSKDIETDNKEIQAGSIIINASELSSDKLQSLRNIIEENKLQHFASDINMKKQSDSLVDVKLPSVALLTGQGLNSYEVGDAYFMLDYRWNIPITKLEMSDLGRANLGRYTTIIMADGNPSLSEDIYVKLKEWMNEGGNLIAMRRSIKALGLAGLVEIEEEEKQTQGDGQVIGGAMFWIDIDNSHPLFWGYENEKIPIFKKGTQWYKNLKEASTQTVASYSKFPLISGYASKENLYVAPYSSAIMTKKEGKGNIILLVDNPNFRGYWFGGGPLFGNSIFYSN